MKWTKVYYDTTRGYIKYVSGDYTIKRTHNKNIWTGREMGAVNQKWEIFKNGEKIWWEFTFSDAKKYVEKL